MTTGRSRVGATGGDLVERALAFPMDEIVALYAGDVGISLETARFHERELKRWLALAALNPDAEYVMLATLDEIWHAFILFTRKYAQFCDEVAGRFVHHAPRVEGKWYRGRILDRYERFYHDYALAFGEEPPIEVWPTPAELVLSVPELLPT